MNEIKIFLDDQADEPGMTHRKTPIGYIAVKTPSEFRALVEKSLLEGKRIAAISFDNDLGSEHSEEGQDLLKWLKEKYPEIFLGDIELKVHSKNNVAGPRMEAEIRKLMEDKVYVKNIIEAKNLPDPWASLPMK